MRRETAPDCGTRRSSAPAAGEAAPQDRASSGGGTADGAAAQGADTARNAAASPQAPRDILSEITRSRREALRRQGFTLGVTAPEKRGRAVVPFLPGPGTILEIKRASPSRGDIAPGLDAAATAAAYVRAGTAAISVLTEQKYFRGSPADLLAAGEAVGTDAALLRKDFLLSVEEIDVSFLFGADAVLLIARILDAGTLLSMARRTFALGMAVLLEIREDGDIGKALDVMRAAHEAGADDRLVLGINSRDLSSFTIDPLIPLVIRRKLLCACRAAEKDCAAPFPRIVSESGITSGEAAAAAGRAGFAGILVGEAAARSPETAAELVRAFCAAAQGAARARNAGDAESAPFCEKIAALLAFRPRRPLVKICGITNRPDAETAAECGADLLGFVFSEKSPRRADARVVREIRGFLDGRRPPEVQRPLLVGVITEPDSEAGKTALSLAEEGVLDCIQFHACRADGSAGYPALRIGCADDIQAVREAYRAGHPRVLADAFAPEAPGGTGRTIAAELVAELSRLGPLWLAGGITPENAAETVAAYRPELIDVSSGVERSPGIKDGGRIASLFRALGR